MFERLKFFRTESQPVQIASFACSRFVDCAADVVSPRVEGFAFCGSRLEHHRVQLSEHGPAQVVPQVLM